MFIWVKGHDEFIITYFNLLHIYNFWNFQYAIEIEFWAKKLLKSLYLLLMR